jgi:very-short-patch-repair endonuclease
VRKGTRILTPYPLSKSGEGESHSPSPDLGKGLGDGDCCLPSARLGKVLRDGADCSPSPGLGKGLGDGVGKGSGDGVLRGLKEGEVDSTPIESLRPGDLVLTHFNRMMPVLEVVSRQNTGEMLEVEFCGASKSLYITPNHPVAGVAPALPPFLAQVSTARHMRKNQTLAETHMWSLLRKKQLGTRFRRQHPMGPFILDFYAPEVRLAIEVDGAVHDLAEQKEYDNFRQKLIEQHNTGFMRFRNSELENSPEEVAVQVAAKVTERRSRFDHKVRWVPAGELQPGMSVFACGQRDVHIVKRIRRISTTEMVYNLRVAEDNSYVTETCTVHNCGSGTTAAVAENWGASGSSETWASSPSTPPAICPKRQDCCAKVLLA